MTMKRFAAALIIAIALQWPFASAEAGSVARATRQFGTVVYAESIAARDRDELPVIGAPDKVARLSLEIPVPIGALKIADTLSGMRVELGGGTCRVSIGIDGYRNLSLATITRYLRQLQSGCGWSDAAMADTIGVLESRAGDLQNALAYMRRRAIDLLGTDIRCDPEPDAPPNKGSPVIYQRLDGGPSLPSCGESGPVVSFTHSAQ